MVKITDMEAAAVFMTTEAGHGDELEETSPTEDLMLVLKLAPRAVPSDLTKVERNNRKVYEGGFMHRVVARDGDTVWLLSRQYGEEVVLTTRSVSDLLERAERHLLRVDFE